MHTEDEAKLNWCPFAKIEEGDGNVCKASACMAWRWCGARVPHPEGLTETYTTQSGIVSKRTVFVRTGYCGQAGKP